MSPSTPKLSAPVCDDPSEGTPKMDAYPLIPEGIYDIQYIGHDGPKAVFGPGEMRLYLRWRVVSPGSCHGIKLFQSFKHYERWGTQSSFYEAWAIANGARPRVRTRMSLAVFKNKIFRAYIRTVKPVYDNGPMKGKPKPGFFQYSLVDRLLEVIAGGRQN